jgi:hypothetical protein
MLHPPCPLHTRREHEAARKPPEGGFIWQRLGFSHPEVPWCGFLLTERRLFWAFREQLVLVFEIGPRWGTSRRVNVHDLWVARRECDCRPLIAAMCAEEQALGSTPAVISKDWRGSCMGSWHNAAGSGPTAWLCGGPPLPPLPGALIEGLGRRS